MDSEAGNDRREKSAKGFSEIPDAWIVEKGLYGIWIGNSSADIDLCGVLSTAEDALLEKVQHICPIQETLKEIRRPDDTAHRMEQAWKKYMQAYRSRE